MQTQIAPEFQNTALGREADAILRSCVHCGFCTATCPTYQLLGDERDGPRGRIYLVKQLFEGEAVSERTLLHLDRCLGCRACETTCPSGVRYARLADLGRHVLEKRLQRPLAARLVRKALRTLVPYPTRFNRLLTLGRIFKPLLPAAMAQQLPAIQPALPRPAARHPRTLLCLEGCVQSAATPATNAAAARVFDRLGISLEFAEKAGCCGALSHHLGAHEEGLAFMRRNIDAWWPAVSAGAEAILINASGCGAVVKEYGELLRDDPIYADKAQRISALARDASEILNGEDLTRLRVNGDGKQVAFHAPCSLQHAQRITGKVESILGGLGYQVTEVRDAHLCCGSAGTYSLLQPKLADQLRRNKLDALQAQGPDIIASANIGCQLHLAQQAKVPIVHWLELLDRPTA